MPSTAFGPLVEPGWPSSLPRPPDLGERFLNGWQLGASVRLKKDELEGKLAEYALRDKEHQVTDALKEREFQFKMNQADAHGAYLERVLGLREETERLQNERVHKAFDRQDRKLEDISGYDAYIRDSGAAGLDPLNPDYVTTHMDAKRLYPMSDVKSEDAVHDQNAALRGARTNIATKQKQYLATVGRDYFQNSVPDAGVFNQPYRQDEGFETEQTDREKELKIPARSMPITDPTNRAKGTIQQGQTLVDEDGNQRKFKLDKNGHFIPANETLFYTPATANSKFYYSRIPHDKLSEIQKRLKGFDDQDKALPPEISAGTNMNAKVLKAYNPQDYERIPVGVPFDYLDDNGVWHHYKSKGN